ncbi:iron chelate uptake ABC transporter family permease subunit [Hyphomicrobium sp. D-2]|uniref:FecCD family ABC transporter permease n=1 Tax=Hyphomicrobium sp. D-2 TaxID=3041621 RepID=UPI0024557674|nr:iron chelate uptake ABC transporter family permease subunit [Hyphomicrobium sp. D-2]MDH4983559.1 iron chelate uptake ABC transporter family permease subunit [Hyphomicrobium sp. D-2]
MSAAQVIIGSAVLLAVAIVASLSLGPTGITLSSLPRALSAAISGTTDATIAREQLVLLDIRLPRTLLGIFVGASLAIAGAIMQGLFRNPLADPGLVGVSSGAALFAVATIVLGNGIAAPILAPLGIYALPVAAFFGGMVTTLILVTIAGRHGQLMIGTLLLAGIALGALSGALTGLLAYASDDRQLRDLTFWSMGSLGGANWPKILAVLPFGILIALLTPLLIRGLNGFLLGEAEAFHLGINVERTKRIAIVATAASVGAAVAMAGVIGFIGIVVPHIIRLLAGPDHRVVLPGSALFGAALLLFADIIARLIVRPAELPIGIVMAAIGTPVFLHLVMKRGIGGSE